MAPSKFTLDHIPAEHHYGIGLVANAWAYLEGQTERIIWRLARLNDKRGAAITTHMGIKARIDAANALAVLEFPKSEATARLKKLSLSITKGLYGKRNELVHSRTIHFPNSLEQLTIRPTYKARGELKVSLKDADVDEYKTTANEIMGVFHELRLILAEFIAMIRERDGEPRASQ